MEFKYGRTLREHNFSPKHRPKPSPMKNDIFRKDLGLDDEDDSLPDLSSSSEEEDSDQPSEIEFNILQKELQTCSQQRDALREKYIESQSTVQHLKARLQKEEISKKSRMKIMQRTQADVLKDKQKLINDLQDILDENGDHSNLKLVSSIEQLHREKADLHSDLMVAFEEYETKISEMEDRLRNAATPIINGRKDDVPQEVIEEKEKLERKLEEMQRIQSDEKTGQDKLLQQKEDETKALRQEQERMKRSSDALQSEIHDLKENSKKSEEASQKKIKLLNSQIKSLESEKDKLCRNLESLENESTNHVKDQMNFDRQ
uniref:Uncharacterized protein n=1 Tax=Ciona savignyi TaxID=51511 RepID=H2ZNV0_CIOSA